MANEARSRHHPGPAIDRHGTASMARHAPPGTGQEPYRGDKHDTHRRHRRLWILRSEPLRPHFLQAGRHKSGQMASRTTQVRLLRKCDKRTKPCPAVFPRAALVHLYSAVGQTNREVRLFLEYLPDAHPTVPYSQNRYARLVGCRSLHQDFRRAQPAKRRSIGPWEEQSRIRRKSSFHAGSREPGRS